MSGSVFGGFLVERGEIDPGQLKKALEMQRVAGGRLGTNLLELGLMRERPLLEALGEFRHCATMTGHQLRGLRPEVVRLVPVRFARRHRVVPVERQGNTVLLASCDPGDPLVEDEVGLMNGCLARTAIGLEVHVEAALGRYYGAPLTARIEGLARRLAGAAAGVRRAPPADAPPPIEPKLRIPDSAVPLPRPSAKPAAVPPPRSVPARRDAESSRPAAAVAMEIEYVELDAESQAMLAGDSGAAASSASAEATPEALLARAAEALGHTEIRDDVADVLLEHCTPHLERRLILIRRKDSVLGWRGAGPGIDASSVRALEIAATEPSIFLSLEKGADFWLAPLPNMPANQRLLETLGGKAPKDCLVLPIRLRSRVVAFLYGDNGGVGTAGAPLDELRRLVGKAGLAFEILILKNKIRNL